MNGPTTRIKMQQALRYVGAEPTKAKFIQVQIRTGIKVVTACKGGEDTGGKSTNFKCMVR